MATVLERPLGSRKQSGRSAERKYLIKGAADDTDARNLLLTDLGVPTTIATLENTLTRIDTECEVEEIGNGDYEGTCPYAVAEWSFQQANSFHISFDIGGASQKITQSRQTISRQVPTGGISRDFKGAINVNKDGTIDGCEIIVPAMMYTINYTFPNSTVDAAWIRTVAGVVASVNSDTWHGFEAGECLLSRVSGQKREDTNWDLSFGVAISYNEPSLTVGAIGPITKKGWYYLWVFYDDAEEDVGGGVKVVHPVPVQANVEQVYRESTYGATLGF